MTDKTIVCVYCQKTIKLSNKQRHEKSKACIQIRAKSDIVIYMCNYCNMSFDDINKKNKHENNLQCESKLLFEHFQISLSLKDEEIENLKRDLVKKNTAIELLKKQVQMLAMCNNKKHQSHEQTFNFNSFKIKPLYRSECDNKHCSIIIPKPKQLSNLESRPVDYEFKLINMRQNHRQVSGILSYIMYYVYNKFKSRSCFILL